jgi:hypothetical protein
MQDGLEQADWISLLAQGTDNMASAEHCSVERVALTRSRTAEPILMDASCWKTLTVPPAFPNSSLHRRRLCERCLNRMVGLLREIDVQLAELRRLGNEILVRRF